MNNETKTERLEGDITAALAAVTVETAVVLVIAALGGLGAISAEAVDNLAVALGQALNHVIEQAKAGEFSGGETDSD
jgi:xanthine dehydrogenase iron-sulfur cluster and FAD-binding subunit A